MEEGMTAKTPDSPDRRRAPRLPVDLTVELDEATGRTRDVSASGVYFQTRQALAPGTAITFTLMLEDAAIFLAEPTAPSAFRLECEGRIVRVEEREGTLGVAAALKICRLVPHQGEVPPPLAPRKGFV